MKKIKITEQQVLLLQAIDETIKSKKIKVTKEQFGRIFESLANSKTATNEIEVKPIKIPKAKSPSAKIQKNYMDGDKVVKNLKSVIKTENKSLLGHPVGGVGGAEYTPQTEKENEKTTQSFNESAIKERLEVELIEFIKHTLEFLKDVISNPSNAGLLPFWSQLGISRGELFKITTNIGLIAYAGTKGFVVHKHGFKEKLKKLYDEIIGKPKPNVETINDNTVCNECGVPSVDSIEPIKMAVPVAKAPVKKQITRAEALKKIAELTKVKSNPTVEVTEDNYPAGAANDPKAPWNKKEPEYTKPSTPKTNDYVVLHKNNEIAIAKDKSGQLYSLYVYDIENSDMHDFASVPRKPIGKDETGEVEYDYDNIEIDEKVIEGYLNHNIEKLTKGVGVDGWDTGKDLVTIDNNLKNQLLSTYSKDKQLPKVLGMHETTTATASGAFVAPMTVEPIKRPMLGEDEIEETTTATSSGSYVTPKVWAKSKKDHIPSKKTQWPGGQMVKIGDCTKLNNNKVAQNGGCSSGAVDNVVKLTKIA